MPLPVYKSVPIEFQGSLRVLARSVLAVLDVAGRVGFGSVVCGNVDGIVRFVMAVEI